MPSAGFVMLGSALETLLALMVNAHADEAEQTGTTPLHKGKPKALLNWQLAGLLRVAKAANWLPFALDLQDEWNSRKARIGDYAEVTRQIRNLAHPRPVRCGSLSQPGRREISSSSI
jgi:hypothetical protein